VYVCMFVGIHACNHVCTYVCFMYVCMYVYISVSHIYVRLIHQMCTAFSA
jgi:hypothetical protein